MMDCKACREDDGCVCDCYVAGKRDERQSLAKVREFVQCIGDDKEKVIEWAEREIEEYKKLLTILKNKKNDKTERPRP
jgi:hypothetical protein